MMRTSLGTWLFSLAALAACSQVSTSQEQFSRLVGRGRVVTTPRLPLLVDVPVEEKAAKPELAGILALSRDEGDATVTWALLDTVASPAYESESLEVDARNLVLSKLSLIGIEESEIILPGKIVESSPRLMSVFFRRAYAGVEVRDATLQIVFAKDESGMWKHREIVNNTFGPILVKNIGDAAPTWDAVAKTLSQKSWTLRSSREVIYAKLTSGDLEDGKSSIAERSNQPPHTIHTLATEFEVLDETSIRHVFSVEHGTQALLEVYRDEYSAASPLTAKVYKGSYFTKEFTQRLLPDTPVTLGGKGAGRTDGQGLLDVNGETSVTLELNTNRLKVVRSGRASPASFTLPLTVTNPAKEPTVTPTGEALSALGLYTSLLEVNQFVRRHYSETQIRSVAIIDQAPPTVLYAVVGSCNAFYQGESNTISIFSAGRSRGGDDCPDMALITDVGVHEWGHGLDAYAGGITDGAFSEGIGDILATYWMRSSRLGVGITVGKNTPIRDVDNAFKYPSDLTDEVHLDGRIISGAFWDTRKGLIQRHGDLRGSYLAEQLFLRHLLDTNTYLQSYVSVLRLDDDDGNTQTRSPNYCTITQAFAKHGLAPNEDCTDPALVPNWTKDIALALSVPETGANNGFRIQASTSDMAAPKMGLCLVSARPGLITDPTTMDVGALRDCVEKGRWTDILVKKGDLGGRAVFEGSRFYALDGQKRLILATLTDAGKTLNAREFRLQEK